MSGFVSIPNAVMRDRSLSITAKCVFGVVLSYAWGDEGSCFKSREDLCAEVGCGKTAFFDAVSALEARGLLRREKRKTPAGWANVYVPVAQGARVSDGPDSEGGSLSEPGPDSGQPSEGGSSGEPGSSPDGQGLTATRTGVVRQTVTEEDERKKTRESERASAKEPSVDDLLAEAYAKGNQRFQRAWSVGQDGDKVRDHLAELAKQGRGDLALSLAQRLAVESSTWRAPGVAWHVTSTWTQAATPAASRLGLKSTDYGSTLHGFGGGDAA